MFQKLKLIPFPVRSNTVTASADITYLVILLKHFKMTKYENLECELGIKTDNTAFCKMKSAKKHHFQTPPRKPCNYNFSSIQAGLSLKIKMTGAGFASSNNPSPVSP